MQVNLLFLVSSTCFGRCFRLSSGARDCIYSIWQYSPKLLPAGVMDELKLKWKHCPKHVELTRNNKLTCIVASYWLLSFVWTFPFLGESCALSSFDLPNLPTVVAGEECTFRISSLPNFLYVLLTYIKLSTVHTYAHARTVYSPPSFFAGFYFAGLHQ
jgi:hypothetical protein